MNHRSNIAIRAALCLAVTLTTLFANASEQASIPSSSASNSHDAVVAQPRPFGYFIGDIVRKHVLLPDEDFEIGEMPQTERIGVWFERRPVKTIVSSEDGRRWLILEYQIINAPQELATIEIPGFELEDATGTRGIAVPASSIDVAPLTTALPEGADLAGALRPDRAAPHIATSPIQRRLVIYATAFALTLLSWLSWIGWRNWRARTHLPFASAWQEIRELDDREARAWQALHRAFDRTAGRVTHSATVAELFDQAPHLVSQRDRIEQFFRQSSDFFFGSGLPEKALSVRELCRDLRRIEERHER